MEGPANVFRRVSPISVVGETMRAARFGLPYGRVPQSNRSMDRQTFSALGRVLAFMCENTRDIDVPQSIEEDGMKVKEWIDNYRQHFT
jgi:hypothetical protein